ncbi:hypothetical protein BLNAU_2666 [Blattamonas nauphoetae]|uniref:Integral membrane protein n=1 Tax=Blattamonas nauphoetae TaxID=2049346 RepID=A0ABQ9YFE3_9EUKA|nr:hypothetical protein BLNAU_2666 [Blattamonas nauphoetae]
MEKKPLTIQQELLESCPIVYGPGSWPISIITAVNVAVALFVFHEMISTIHKGKWRQNYSRHIFIICLTIFISFRIITSLLPIGWNYTTALIFCDQIPRYFFFMGWEFISMWLGTAILASQNTRRCFRVTYHLSYAILIGLTLITTSVTSYIRHLKKDKTDGLRYLSVASNSLMYLTVSISLGIYFFRLLRILCDSMLIPTLKSRIVILTILVGTVFGIYVIRLVWAILKATGVNVLQNILDGFRDKCSLDDMEYHRHCTRYYAYSGIVLFIFEAVPTILLLVTFTLLKLHVSNKRKAKSFRAKQMSINDSSSFDTSYGSYASVSKPRKKGKKKKRMKQDSTPSYNSLTSSYDSLPSSSSIV